ncbi:MAG TPA: hypothetical protein VN451_00695 [Chitinophagaceae bacterium]|nr:hypothetical protein [Chitinophagaceae bacterium]
MSLSAEAQKNRIKLGFIGFPSESGFAIGDIGYERLSKELNSSWQFHFSASGGTIAIDAGTETRKWVTVEKTFYRKTVANKITWSYSFFTEAGCREKNPGRVPYIPEKILINTKQFEINPGASLGIQLRFGKKWGIETQVGPKIIIATGKEYYRNNIINQPYSKTFHNLKAGYRLIGTFAYQF